ncbi:GTP-binding protein, putative [Entamoeba nuttalli P19]|uniref:GTP-binding protein, putative n=1 Tax=Entamoeba nuttalli (strain P19) TaxID=1076696 RepID=K2HXQ3_ENTNP|nr:GTP-binding protein, putative [Entamoeba nuttalli P19]EKE41105.1 GTP-binding protein, putative [Entamoeba nuttalli P19]|eukprot:XP_008856566.1 GTP-binding protein, putative [Entamoeba nuttalli P19]
MSIQQKINDIELELSRTQVNKATMHHICLLRGKLVKYQKMLAPIKFESCITGEELKSFDYGDSRVGIVGMSGVGKTTLFELIKEEDADGKYESNGYKYIPGIIENDGKKLELIDIPTINDNSNGNKGKNRNKIGLDIAKTCDLLIILCDGTKEEELKDLLVNQLEAVGIRINKKRPSISIEKKERGGIKFISSCEQPDLTTDRVIELVQKEFLIESAEIKTNERITEQDLIDTLTGDVKYIQCLFVLNKCDVLDDETKEILTNEKSWLCISADDGENIDVLLEKIWEIIGLFKVYPKTKAGVIDLDHPIILSYLTSSVEYFCFKYNKSLLNDFKYALVWGNSVAHSPQQVNKDHLLQEDDTVQIFTK